MVLHEHTLSRKSANYGNSSNTRSVGEEADYDLQAEASSNSVSSSHQVAVL